MITEIAYLIEDIKLTIASMMGICVISSDPRFSAASERTIQTHKARSAKHFCQKRKLSSAG